MKLSLRTLALLPCLAAFLTVAGTAHANTISGVVYDTPAYPAPLAPHGPGTAALATFTVTNINFFSDSSNYTIAGFLTSNGNALPTFSNPVGGLTLNNKAFEFTGTTYLAAGTYTVTHDDGMFLYLNGSSTCAICSGDPTAAAGSNFTVAAGGNYSFDLWYAEVNGAPATLNAPFAKVAATPEPSSFILLGTGLFAAAGIVRRRLSL